MPVSAGQIKALLDQHRSAFSSFTRANAQLFNAYQQAWLDFSSLDLAGQQQRLRGLSSPRGAAPLELGDRANQGIIPFFFAESAPARDRWSNRE
ncbi:MAG: NurA domain-containing protein, partial [Nodosilinea sp.]